MDKCCRLEEPLSNEDDYLLGINYFAHCFRSVRNVGVGSGCVLKVFLAGLNDLVMCYCFSVSVFPGDVLDVLYVLSGFHVWCAGATGMLL